MTEKARKAEHKGSRRDRVRERESERARVHLHGVLDASLAREGFDEERIDLQTLIAVAERLVPRHQLRVARGAIRVQLRVLRVALDRLGVVRDL